MTAARATRTLEPVINATRARHRCGSVVYTPSTFCIAATAGDGWLDSNWFRMSDPRLAPRRFPELFWGLVALALALVLAGWLGARGIADARRAADDVEVTGSARRSIRSDFIVLRGAVSAQGASLPGAYSEVTGHATRLRAYLREQGVPDSVVSFRALETYPIPEIFDGRETGRVLGYRLTQSFEIRSADVDGLGELANRATELISDGVPLVVYPPEYLYTRLSDIRIEMLAAATEDARARAEAIARSAGGEVGGVRSVRMGVFQITPRFSTEVSDYGINDTSALEKDVTAVVRVSFSLD